MPRSNPLLKCHPEARKRDRVQNIQRTAAMQFFLYMEGESLPLVRTSLLSTPSSGCSKPCKRESQPCLYGYDRASWVSANAAFATPGIDVYIDRTILLCYFIRDLLEPFVSLSSTK